MIRFAIATLLGITSLYTLSAQIASSRRTPPPIAVAPTPWGNPSCAAEGKASPRQEFISYTIRKVAEKGDPNETEHYLPLQGEWRVMNSLTNRGGEPNFYSPRYDVSSWLQVQVPNLISAYLQDPFQGLVPPALPVEIPMVQYRAEIDIPSLWLDRDLYLHIAGVGSAYTLYVNDQRVGFSNDSRTPAEYNISSALSDGLNSIGIEVYGYSTGNWLEQRIPLLEPGRLGQVYLYSQPKLCIHDFTITAKLDSAGHNGLLRIDAILSNSYRRTDSITFGYDIYEPNGGKLITYNLLQSVIPAQSKDTLHFMEYIYPSSKKMWSPQTPDLYTMMLYVRRDGRIIEYIPFQVGFNETELRDGELWVNRKKAQLSAVEYNAAHDQATTEKELKVLKTRKYNTICVAYPQPRWFYELCDRIGFYVVDQANINASYCVEDRNVGGSLTNNPDFLPAYLDRVAQMQGRTKNYTSVIAISMGGESGNGYNMYKAYQYLKAVDTLHAVTYRHTQGEWNADWAFPQVAKSPGNLLEAPTSSVPATAAQRRR